MRTPIQEMYVQLRAKMMTDSFYYEELPAIDHLFEIEGVMLDIEKQLMLEFAQKCKDVMATDEYAISECYNKTFSKVDDGVINYFTK